MLRQQCGPSNPFMVKTPEDLGAAEAAQLFVDVFTDFYKIRDPGHAMLNGPRGSGKSMMFRYLEPDCQCIATRCEIRQLDFFAVLISMKNTELNLTELRTLSGKGVNAILNEHFLTMYVASKVFTYVADLKIDPNNHHLDEITAFIQNVVNDRLIRCGLKRELLLADKYEASKSCFKALADLLDRLYQDVGQYIKRLFPGTEPRHFDGPLCGYLDFLHPVLRAMRTLSFMPEGPVYLLMDDADTLSSVQTRVLNSWVGTRTSYDVSIKISTQMRYKTFAKISGGSIETPHDYSEVNIADLYTTKRGKYLNRLSEIVSKRLKLSDLDISPEQFFPAFRDQENRVKEIEAKILRREHPVAGKGFRITDDVQRYARPIYMQQLAGSKKASSKYSYAGFEQLVHISSGLIRYFLEAAALMFSEQRARTPGEVKRIEPGVQNAEIRQMSTALMTSEFDKIVEDDGDQGGDHSDTTPEFIARRQRLRNLILTLGGTFRQKLLSDDAERRVFSVAISDEPAPDVVDTFELGVKYGYFQKSTIGNKDGTGRTTLYILTRRLAPYFTLDPSGFAGYLFVTNERLREGMVNPQSLLRRVKSEGVRSVFGEDSQLRLFE